MGGEVEPVIVEMRGAGGVVWPMDLPRDGSFARERFDEQVAKGELQFVGQDPRASAAPEPAADPDEIPHKVDDVVDWVRGGPEGSDPADGWPDRAQRALDAETAKGDKARPTLVEKLEDIVASAAPEPAAE